MRAPLYKHIYNHRFKISIIILCLVLLFISRPSSPISKASPHNLRIATFNLYYLGASATSIAKTIKAWDIDIIVFLEYSTSSMNKQSMNKAGYKADFTWAQPGTHGIAIYSKHNIDINAALLPSPINGPCRMPFAVAKVNYQKQEFNLIAVHAPPPIDVCNNTTDKTIDAVSTWLNNGKLINDVSILTKELPTFVLGDLNSFPFNSSIKNLESAGLVDSDDYCVNWLCPTWSPRSYIPSMIRIDYIFSPHSIAIEKSWSVHIDDSDHRGVISELKF